MKIKIFYILLALGLFFYSELIQGKEMSKLPANFRGNIKLIGNIKSSADSLTIRYGVASDILGKENKIHLVTDKNGDFNFKLPLTTIPYFVQILVKYKKGYNRLTEHYFSENGDDVFIQILKGKDTNDKSTSVVFSGLGSEKYNMVHVLDKLYSDFNSGYAKLFEPGNLTAENLSQNAEAVIELNKKKEALIQKLNVGDAMKRMITYEHARFFLQWGINQYDLYMRNDQFRLLISSNFNLYKNRFKYKVDPVMVNCPVFLQSLIYKEVFDLTINAAPNSLTVKNVYDALINRYQGPIRERLLVNLFTKGLALFEEIKFNESVFDSLTNEAAILVNTPSLKRMLTDRVRLQKGAALLDVTFADINGKAVELKSLRGKVVLIDFWVIGCGACAAFHKIFHEKIYPQLKENNDFVYLSVNGSKSRRRWMEGLNAGIYSSSDYLNVSIGNLGLNHPFALYYNINAYPFLLLVGKDGKIISSKRLASDQAAKLIKDALDVKYNDTSSL